MSQAREAWTVIYNIPVICGVVAWAIAQALKMIFHFCKTRKWDWTRLVGSGGMPSSHTSFCVAVTVAVGLEAGFVSPAFAVAAMITAIVMSDAAGVRRAAGQQAKVINEIIEMLQSHQPITQVKLRELLGHTRLEVLAGFVLGVVVAMLISLT